MGGASRAEKRRKQEAAEARLRAAGITPKAQGGDTKRTTFIAVAVLAVVALVVGVTVLLTRDTGEPVVPTYTATAEGGVVTAGSGPIVVDVYSDYLCPACERFEERYGEELTTALNNGQITVRYHLVAILDERSDPPGYSTRAAAAALCSVPAGIFPAYHERLFDEQPSESGAGLSDERLVAIGTELGAGGDFAACVTGEANEDAVTAETEAAVANPALRRNGSFGTPTVTVDGALVEVNDPGWLQNAITG
ncbi:MAG: thioredoxin domain-containing protein [Pseudonocardia sp.]|nr:thioredoxin domain-containing protein [Pseudonocardia sp.]